MNHLKAIGIKFIVISIVLYSILAGFYTATIGNIFVISLLVTGVAYVLGDLFILPRFGNLIASIADLGLAFLSIWLLSSVFFAEEYGIMSASLFSAILISCSEAVFHLYMNSKVFHKDEDVYINRDKQFSGDFVTEFGEEEYDSDVINLKDKSDKK
ncbi:YndM family protein [Aquibacillus kalidii]|uniref:YndM family protein n=1 Tax=Aquibacillus kalidii TaxID=2762597 RepID=UPI0016463CD9|nr:YndM family protein [Aquibacillus kalidii]